MRKLLLFVDSTSRSSKLAIQHIQTLCQDSFSEHYTFDILDIEQETARAQELDVFLVPSLVVEDDPAIRLFGDMSDRDLVLATFELGTRGNAQ